MKRRNLAVILLLAIFLPALAYYTFQIISQTNSTLEIRGYTWNHSTISVSIIPSENETWWEPLYLNATLHAISQWNDAIQEFSSNNANFSYISNVNLVPTTSTEEVSGFDIYVKWNCTCDREDLIGQSQATIQSSCFFAKNTISLTAKAPSGHVMTEVDMQNIVVHEIGHTLGLSHSNYPKDVMYSKVEYRNTVKPVSSLDVYCLSQIFNWIPNSTELNASAQLNSTNICFEKSVISLPQSISYVHYKINPKNIPVTSQNLIEDIVELFLRPESLTILSLIIVIIVATMIQKKRNGSQRLSL